MGSHNITQFARYAHSTCAWWAVGLLFARPRYKLERLPTWCLDPAAAVAPGPALWPQAAMLRHVAVAIALGAFRICRRHAV